MSPLLDEKRGALFKNSKCSGHDIQQDFIFVFKNCPVTFAADDWGWDAFRQLIKLQCQISLNTPACASVRLNPDGSFNIDTHRVYSSMRYASSERSKLFLTRVDLDNRLTK